MSAYDYLSVFLLGLLGSGHCVGMCGGFAVGIGGPAGSGRALVWRHVAYQSGKALTYLFLAVLVTVGTGLLTRARWFSEAQVALAVLVGALMILLGAAQALEWRSSGWWRRVVEPLPICGAMSRLFAVRSLWGAFGIGWLNGFLPCGLLLGALLYLASFQSVAGAALGALCFGAGTFPALFLLGLTARQWRLRSRRRLVRLSGVLLIGFGALTTVRGVPAVHHWFHHHLVIPAGNAWRDWCGS